MVLHVVWHVFWHVVQLLEPQEVEAESETGRNQLSTLCSHATPQYS
jgi:hypothetical protein